MDPAYRCMADIEAQCVRGRHQAGELAFASGGRVVLHGSVGISGPAAIHVSTLFAVERGGGRAAMRVIIDAADRHGVDVTLTAASYVPSRMTTQQLVDWYRRLGFEVVAETRAWARAVDMIRRPRGGAPAGPAASPGVGLPPAVKQSPGPLLDFRRT